jgi:hypothetical protein
MLEQGRESFRKQAWGAAFTQLSAADREILLEPEDLVQLAQAAYLIGKELEGADFLARAHQGFLSRGETALAARSAFWVGFTSLFNGEFAKAGGGSRERAACWMASRTAWKKDIFCCRRGFACFKQAMPWQRMPRLCRQSLSGRDLATRTW